MDDPEHAVLWWCLKDYSCRSRSWRCKGKREEILECLRAGRVEISLSPPVFLDLAR
jgi:hypothetical protein